MAKKIGETTSRRTVGRDARDPTFFFVDGFLRLSSGSVSLPIVTVLPYLPPLLFSFKKQTKQNSSALTMYGCEGGHGLTTTHGEKAQTSKFSEYFHFFLSPSVCCVPPLRITYESFMLQQ